EPATGEGERAEPAHENSGADRGREKTDPAPSGVQEPEGDDDDQDVQRAAHERLREEERDDQTWLRFAGDEADACGQLGPGAMVGEAKPAFDPDRGKRERRRAVRDRSEDEHT